MSDLTVYNQLLRTIKSAHKTISIFEGCGAAIKNTYDLKNKKILLVDDVDINLKIVERIIRHHGGAVTTASNGKEAAELFISSFPGEFSAVLMDIQMPGMNGYEAVAVIRGSKHPDALLVPIIALTSQDGEEDIKRCFECGMDRYMKKPFQPSALLRAIIELSEKEGSQTLHP